MRQVVLAFAGAFAVAVAALPAAAATEEPSLQGTVETTDTAKVPGSGDLERLPDGGAIGSQSVVGPQVIRSNKCIKFPGQTWTYSFFAGFPRNFYFVVPSGKLDVVMKITLKGFKTKTVDKFGRGGTESFAFLSPSVRRPVTVKISGFGGTTGCFHFEAQP